MLDSFVAHVVVPAGGLGTRVHRWAQFVPKEFYPVDGRPGILCLLHELAELGPARVAIVYHPYYEQFAAWSRQVLDRRGNSRYTSAAGCGVAQEMPAGLSVSFIPQRGPYGDLTSVLNGADYLAAPGRLHVAFADNIYPEPGPLPLLRDASRDEVAVLAGRYRRALAPSRGVLVTSADAAGRRAVRAVFEKPVLAEARTLEDDHGLENLLLLEGRALLTGAFIEFARDRQCCGCGAEPKLALALGAYAREHPVIAVPGQGEFIDLGMPSPTSGAGVA
jgi:UTP-glucose-1-phosphate uridylyltransferase